MIQRIQMDRRLGIKPTHALVPKNKPRLTAADQQSWEYKLEFQRGERIYDPIEEQIRSAITSLRVVEGDSYCILERRHKGYVQVMCGVNGMHVEWRDLHGTNGIPFEHYKAGYPQPPKEKTPCRKAVYVLPGYDNELLNRNDARTIFLSFRRTRTKPAEYTWRLMDDEELS